MSVLAAGLREAKGDVTRPCPHAHRGREEHLEGGWTGVERRARGRSLAPVPRGQGQEGGQPAVPAPLCGGRRAPFLEKPSPPPLRKPLFPTSLRLPQRGRLPAQQQMVLGLPSPTPAPGGATSQRPLPLLASFGTKDPSPLRPHIPRGAHLHREANTQVPRVLGLVLEPSTS